MIQEENIRLEFASQYKELSEKLLEIFYKLQTHSDVLECETALERHSIEFKNLKTKEFEILKKKDINFLYIKDVEREFEIVRKKLLSFR